MVENIRSLDRDLTKYDQIYNVYTRWIDFPAVGPINLTTSYFTANELTNHFPQIEHTASITSTGDDDWWSNMETSGTTNVLSLLTQISTTA